VPAVGAFPPHWRPLDSSRGEVNFDRGADRPALIPYWLEGSGFRHYEPIGEYLALTLAPELVVHSR
jgi:hypothetical protein